MLYHRYIHRSAKLKFSRKLKSTDGSSPKVLGVAIGNFDTFHLGHQALFKKVKESTAKLAADTGSDAITAVLSFYPHPRSVVGSLAGVDVNKHPELWPSICLRQKVSLLKKWNFSALCLLHFSKELSQLSPEQFVREILAGELGADIVVVGQDWSFGKGRAGNIQVLSELGEQQGIEIIAVEDVQHQSKRISSSWVKEAISAGDMSLASELLGRNFTLCARVIHGNKRGRQLGFPTANQKFRQQILPKDGIYATVAHLKQRNYHSVTSIGVRPTFHSSNQSERVVETYVLAENIPSLYGELLEVEFIERIRDERKFSSIEELKSAIGSDVQLAREILERRRAN